MTTPGEQAARSELERRLEATTRVTLRPIASPAALGFLGLAGASFTLAGLQLGWVKPADGDAVALIILGFTVFTQLVASIFGFLARDAVIATGMGLLFAIWLAQSLVLLTSEPGETSRALGLFLVAAAVAIWVPAAGALLSKLVPAVVLATAGLRFLLGGLHQLTGAEAWEDVAGLTGLLLAALAIYTALAAELEDATGKPMLPLGRRRKGRVAAEGTLLEQVADVHKEAGVKQQL